MERPYSKVAGHVDPTIPVIMADDVIKGMNAASSGFYFNGWKDIAVAPPFEITFIEYADTERKTYVLSRVETTKHDNVISQAAHSYGCNKEDIFCVLTFRHGFMSRLSGWQLIPMEDIVWVVIGERGKVFTGANGRLGVLFDSENKLSHNQKGIVSEMTQKSLYVMGLLSCRSQIELVPAPFSRQRRRQMERKGEDPTIYKVLKVKAGKKYPASNLLIVVKLTSRWSANCRWV